MIALQTSHRTRDVESIWSKSSRAAVRRWIVAAWTGASLHRGTLLAMPEHHLTCLPHQPYSAPRHGDLLIDLYYLDPETPMMEFKSDYSCTANGNGVKIPLFIAGPLMLLRSRQGEEIANNTESFLNRISGRPSFNPTPECCQCEVCQEVRWLLKDCRCFDDCQSRWCSRDTVFLFEILKEVLSRLKKKLLPYSLFHHDYVNMNQFYISRVLCPDTEKDLTVLALEFDTFAKMQSFFILDATKTPDIYTNVFCCLMTNLIRMLRAYVEGELRCAEGDPSDPDYIFRAIRSFPTEMSRAMSVLASALSPRVIDLKKYYYVPCDSTTFMSSRDEQDRYLWSATNCMRSLLVINAIEPFDRCAEPKVWEVILSNPAVKDLVDLINTV